MSKIQKNEMQKIFKNKIHQNLNNFEANKTNYMQDTSNVKDNTFLPEINFQNIKCNTIPNNIAYKKPSLNNNTNLEIQYPEENNILISEMKENIKHNESKLEKVNKTMQEMLINHNPEQSISKEYYSQINELEKIQQENLSLKSDSIIYREDIIHLSEINRKLKLEYDLAQKKIFDLISKCENSNQILNNKNFEIAQLTEAISNIKLSNSDETMKKIRNNKTKEQKIYEYEFELNGLNKEKIKLETEIKNLEERYNTIIEEKKKDEKEEEFYKNRIDENIFGLEDKIRQLGKQLDELSIINKELKFKNQQYENSINSLKNEKNIFIDKYNQKTEQFNDLENNFNNLENKYNQLLYDIRKRNIQKEDAKTQEIQKNNKKRKSSKQIIVNDLYNKIQELKENIKSERAYNT